MRNLLFTVCLGMMVISASAAFSSQFSSSVAISLANGANAVFPPQGSQNAGLWTTTGNSQFTDGQFLQDGAYIVPVQGLYHFEATVQIQLNVLNTVPLATAALRIVKCNNGCSVFCGTSTNVASTLVQSGTVWLGDAWASGTSLPPTYQLTASFTGNFATGDMVSLCVDNNAVSGAITIDCLNSGNHNCLFSGYTV